MKVDYIIFTLPRTGSTLLVGLLQSTGHFGWSPDFKFNDPASIESTWEHAESPTGRFGFRMHPYHLHVIEQLGIDFSRTQAIHVYRRNMLRQAISCAKAMKTGIWKIVNRLEPDPEALECDVDNYAIMRWLVEFSRWESVLDDFFSEHQIQPLRLAYEDFMDAENHVSVVESIFEFMGIAESPVVRETFLKKVSNSHSDVLYDKFIKECPV